MAGHTPGPWCVEDPMDFELTIVEAGKQTYEWRAIASCSLPEGDDDQDFTSGEVQANAALIAAAPCLLAALRDAYSFISAPQIMSTPAAGPKTATYRIEGYNALTAKLRAAIAKAEGSQ